jgi:methylase of polypeptide subunit release factors
MAAANADFAPGLAAQVERHCAALRDFNGEDGETVALSLGCGVGATATALADMFQRVVAVDASQLCIDAAKVSRLHLVPP